MTNINLLPWREEYRQEKKREFLILLAILASCALLVGVAWGRWVNGEINWQTSRNDLLSREIAVLEEKVKEIKELKDKRQQMLDRMRVIKGLQSDRPAIVMVFDEFVRSVPDGIFFTEAKREKNQIALVGYAESNNRISALMRQLDASGQFEAPNLTEVEADGRLGEQGSQFKLQVTLERSQANGEDDEGNSET